MTVGNVYFLQVGADGPIKIGFTSFDVRRRVRSLQAISPHILRWIGVFHGTRSDEKNAHLLLQNSSLRGEWFYPTVEVRAFVANKSPDFEPVIIDNPLIGGAKRSAETRARQSASIRAWAEQKRRRATEQNSGNS